MKQSEALLKISEKINACKKCPVLFEHRCSVKGKTVSGAGSPNAEIFIIGEAPGAQEEKEGTPFVGKAGKLLTNIIESTGFNREEVFITNILKCRPPGNRDPTPEEAANCRIFLEFQIQCVNPKWILCFGRIASVFLLNLPHDTKIGNLRGKIHNFENRSVICTYHPSYALRQPDAKEEIWKDIQPIVRKIS